MDFADLLAITDVASLRSSLGGVVTYTTGDDESVDVRGYFDATYELVDAGTPGVSTSGPVVFLLLADLPSDPETDDPTITVAGVDYTVREIQKDGQGGVRILLHKASA